MSTSLLLNKRWALGVILSTLFFKMKQKNYGGGAASLSGFASDR